ncbi:hypothetical protein [Massilia suwonensis]|uniref:Lipoprotein n=1 Tax=Massilia suwonensis TaxID=648895 RepID=A0ABW0MM00_9BURK
MCLRRQLLLSVSALGSLAGCAGVRVVSVSHPTEPEGIPYYLPRPYIQVFEPFIIGASNYFVSGVLSADKNYLLIDNVKDQGELGSLFKSDLGKDAGSRIPVAVIRAPGREFGATGSPQGATESGTGPAEGNTEEKSESKKEIAPAAPADSGKYGLSVTTTPTPFPPTLGRRFFDIVWLPDFDEKHVVQGTPGLGKADIGVVLTQGWGLYGMNAKIDNSALARPFLDFYASLGKLAASRITPATALGGAPQGAVDTSDMTAGQRVTVKVTKATVAAPGLYPVLKPAEMASARAAGAADTGKRHLPAPPFTNIAFNTYEAMLVEAAKPSGDSIPGLQQAAPPPPSVPHGRGAADAPYPDQPDADSVASLEKNLNALLANRKSSTSGFWQLSGLALAGGKLKGTATLVGGSSKPPQLNTLEQLKVFLAEQTGARFQPKDIELVEAGDGQNSNS